MFVIHFINYKIESIVTILSLSSHLNASSKNKIILKAFICKNNDSLRHVKYQNTLGEKLFCFH